MDKKVQVYNISWIIDMVYIWDFHYRTGKNIRHLLSDAENEQERLPSEMFLEVEEDADLGNLYQLIEREEGAFYCFCGGYKLEDNDE